MLCAGCAQKREITALDLIGKPFSCKVDITVLNTGFSGKLTKADSENMSLTLSEPKLLSGLTFIKSGSNVGVSMFGLTVSINADNAPSASAADILFDIFSEGGDYDVEVRDEDIQLRRFTDYDTITVQFDKNMLVPFRLHTKNSGVEMLFSEYTLLEDGDVSDK